MQEMGGAIEGVVVALSFLYIVFGKHIIAYAQERAFKDMVSFSFTRKSHAQSIVDGVLRDADALTCELIYANNGGAIASGLGPIFSSIYVNASILGEDQAKDLRDSWQNQELEPQYHDLVLKPLMQHGRASVRRGSMADGDLKNLYTRRGIEMSVICKVSFANGKLWFCSAKFNRILSQDEEDKVADILRIAASSLKKLTK